MVRLRVPVEPALAATGLEFADDTVCREPLEIAVYGGQTQLGQAPPGLLEDLDRGRVRHRAAQLFEDDLPLLRSSAGFFIGHSIILYQ
jgi:hypothetical protein